MKIALSVADMSVGGIANFVLNLSQSLTEAGHEVIVIAQRPGVWWSRLAESGIHGYCLPRRRWDSVQQTARRFAAYLTVQQVDLLLVNIGIDNRIPMLALHRLPDRLPVALVLHNDRPEVYALAAVNAAAWHCAVAVSPKVQQVAQTHFPQKAIYWILHGIALPTPEQLRARVGWRVPLQLLFVGRLDDAQKGIFRLPRLLQHCREQGLPVHLTVIGDGPDRAAVATLCQTVGVTDLVDWVGFQAQEIVLAQMRAHHLLLLPSNFEGLGLVIQEAQANGCVPVASRLPGVTDTIIADGINGKLIEPTEIVNFVATIRNFLNAAEWQQCSQAGIAQARQHYGIGRMMEQYVALFDALGQGAHPLLVTRSSLRKQRVTPFTWRDYLVQPLRRRLGSA
jgi:glycosyltransferase involved in cell wall biosynthesis